MQSKARNSDLITNFNAALDRIDLTGFSATPLVCQASQINGNSIGADTIGWKVNGQNTAIYVNTGGAAEILGSADMKIQMHGAEGDDPLEQPGTILARSARRVRGLALWNDADLDEDWRRLAAAWEAASYDLQLMRRGRGGRYPGRAHRSFDMDTVTGTVVMDDIAPEIWLLLVIERRVEAAERVCGLHGQHRQVLAGSWRV